ncbi:MAG TPA: hypothetical protein VK686_00710 [Bryobacteraceae bacterium]|nr:hypothetical protein [Bryobacteraceae bacterium]
MQIKIGLLASGEISLDGQQVDLEQLDARLSQANSSQDQLLYYKQDQGPEESPHSMEIMKLVVKHKLPISFSTKDDFSDYVDRLGQTHPRPKHAAVPKDRYAPFMPDVDLRRDAPALFAEARTAAANSPDGRGVALIGPDRAIMVIPVPPRSAAMDARVPKLPDIPSDRPANIAVIGNTGMLGSAQGKPPDLQEAAKAIPFLGLLIGLGYAGHHVWIFEGHASALASGLDHAEILVVDSGMIPSLQNDWMAVAKNKMDAPRRVLIFSRDRNAFLPAAPASTPQGWTYAEPDGEASYVNCLLTTLGKAGTGAAAELATDAPLPNLAELTQNPDEREWIANLPFRYDQLDAAKAIDLLTRSRTLMQKLKNEWLVKTLLVADGERRPCEFSLRLDSNQEKQVLSIRVL